MLTKRYRYIEKEYNFFKLDVKISRQRVKTKSLSRKTHKK